MANTARTTSTDVKTTPSKAALALAVQAESIGSSTSFEDIGAIEHSIVYARAKRGEVTALKTFVSYLGTAKYKPVFFRSPSSDDEGSPVVLKSHYLASDGEECVVDVLTTRKGVFDGLKGMAQCTYLTAEEQRLIKLPAKGMSEANKDIKDAANKSVGSYMAMVRKALERHLDPNAGKNGATETRQPIVRLKDELAKLAKFVKSLDSEKTPHFPEHLNITALAKGLAECEALVATAFKLAAEDTSE
jgi:hypothetical protein